MAAKRKPGMSAHEAERVTNVSKDAGNQMIEWHDTVDPASGLVLRRSLTAGVSVAPPCDLGLQIFGQWRSENDIQIHLRVLLDGSEAPLHRLCWTQCHPGVLHWHFYDQVSGPRRQEVVSIKPENCDHVTLLYDIFLPTMCVTNYQQPVVK